MLHPFTILSSQQEKLRSGLDKEVTYAILANPGFD